MKKLGIILSALVLGLAATAFAAPSGDGTYCDGDVCYRGGAQSESYSCGAPRQRARGCDSDYYCGNADCPQDGDCYAGGYGCGR